MRASGRTSAAAGTCSTCCAAPGRCAPRASNGRGTRTAGRRFKLEHLTRANGLDHDSAHDALSDVRATLALARLLKSAPAQAVGLLPAAAQEGRGAGRDRLGAVAGPALPARVGHVRHRARLPGAWSGRWRRTRPTATRSSSGTWRRTRAELPQLDVRRACASACSPAADELPEGVTRLPIKTIHINKSPVVIANLKTLTPAMAQRWGIDVDQALRHADIAARHAGKLAGMWPEVFQRPAAEPARRCRRRPVRRLRRQRGPAHAAAAARPEPAGAGRQAAGLCRPAAGRIAVPLPRAQLPRDAERGRARAVAGALRRPAVRGRRRRPLGLRGFAERIAALETGADERGRTLLARLRDYAPSIAPDCAARR